MQQHVVLHSLRKAICGANVDDGMDWKRFRLLVKFAYGSLYR